MNDESHVTRFQLIKLSVKKHLLSIIIKVTVAWQSNTGRRTVPLLYTCQYITLYFKTWLLFIIRAEDVWQRNTWRRLASVFHTHHILPTLRNGGKLPVFQNNYIILYTLYLRN